ncbi:SPOR domain-containing protein [Weeksellaceae bacterium KMM 9724]|uniref:SPOR domain-containing protein n=1 Tax=Profundicola chukchiensis TaxID=2961959 RepID=UPI00243AE435|nr:SPOR domain-containing protein [Profundicola chukchiensis]MDG4949982.1 SPOR domain-containing protein [Profundicola chukchiensis]
MRHLLFLFLFVFGLPLVMGQISVKDSLSGGSYNLNVNSAIDSLVQKTVKAKCYKPVVEVKPDEDRENFDPCAQNPKVMGYKIQIMYTKDRNAANRAQADFAKNFPSLVPEMVYTRPDYRVMVGDYFTKRSAGMDLASVKKKYPGAFLVQWRVWCRKAK